jgi:hypothetical protein
MTEDRPTTDDRRPTDDWPPVRFESHLARADRSSLIPIAALIVLVSIAALTAGQAATGPTDRGATASLIAAEAAESPPPSASTPSSSRADAGVAAICLEPGSWRTATIETWRDQTVRVWRAIDPVPASGPDDQAIPIVPAVGSRVAAIGFCAPVVGPDRPTGTATIEAWRREAVPGEGASPAPGAVAAGGVAASPLQLRPIVPAGSPSPYGALFAPATGPDGGAGWAPGIIVFRYTQLAGRGPIATWFAIEISLTDASGRPLPPAEPPMVPVPASARPRP